MPEIREDRDNLELVIWRISSKWGHYDFTNTHDAVYHVRKLINRDMQFTVYRKETKLSSLLSLYVADRSTEMNEWTAHGYWIGEGPEPTEKELLPVARARCGGPGMCNECGTELAVEQAKRVGRNKASNADTRPKILKDGEWVVRED